MLPQFKQHLDNSFPFLKHKKIFVAVSGGLDSVVLVYLLQLLKYQIAVLHCNFNLRDTESDGDQQFVQEMCISLKVPLIIQKFNTQKFANEHKLSIQVAARNLRYSWFKEQLNINSYDFLLTAHHLDDSLETFLINLSRGTGIEGLTGIPAQNNTTIRPLLPFSRTDILNFAQNNNIKWREDSSNASTKYLRNKIRIDVIPILKQIQPNLLPNFLNTLKNLNQAQSLIADASKMVYLSVVAEHDNAIEIDLVQLTKLSNYESYLYQWLTKFNFTSWTDVYQLVTAESGKKVFSENYVLIKNRTTLVLSKKTDPVLKNSFFINESQNEVKNPIKISFSDVDVLSITDASTIFVDKKLLLFPLILRKHNNDDLFYPFGFNGKKKVSKFLKDCKLSTIEKNNIWLLCNCNNIVIWIINYRLDNRFKVTDKTNSILKITTS